MRSAPTPAEDEQRLAELHSYGALDTPAEEAFDRLTRLACQVFEAPIATITLVDRDRQWFKSVRGLNTCQTARSISFCGHVVASGEPLIVEDTHRDERFHDNPLVVGDPGIRFYAGVPLTTRRGFHIGVLCVQDTEPRPFDRRRLPILQDLAAVTVDELELRKAHRRLEVEQGIAEEILQRATRSASLALPGVRWHYRPAEALSGDILLGGERPDGSLLFLLGDFTGHGISAAIGAPVLAGRFHDAVEAGETAEGLLSALNREFRRTLPPDMFLAAVLIELDPAQRRIGVWNGGMPALALCGEAGPAAVFPSEGLPLGVAASAGDAPAYPLAYRVVLPGEALYACSDGVLEGVDEQGRFEGQELAALLGEAPAGGRLEQLQARIARAHRLSRERDDATLLELDLGRLLPAGERAS